LHLKRRNVKIKLNRMLLWSDGRFYGKWKRWFGMQFQNLFLVAL
jgi:hypothetical protein